MPYATTKKPLGGVSINCSRRGFHVLNAVSDGNGHYRIDGMPRDGQRAHRGSRSRPALSYPSIRRAGPGQFSSGKTGFGPASRCAYFLHGRVIDKLTGKPISGCIFLSTSRGPNEIQSSASCPKPLPITEMARTTAFVAARTADYARRNPGPRASRNPER